MEGRGRAITVVHVQKFAGISGSEGHLRQLLTTLDRSRITPVLLMLSDGSDPRERAYADALRAAAVRVDRLPLGPHVDPVLILRLWSWFRRERQDIVHTHLVHADLHAGIAARLARVPVLVSTKHNDDRFRLRWPIRRMERALATRTNYTITISDALRSFHLELSAADPSQVTTIRYGYDPPVTDEGNPAAVRQELGIPPEAPVILAVGRLVDQKGHDVLVRALPLVTAPTPEPWLVIADEGDRRALLTRLARDLGINHRVRLVGERDDVGRLMRAATVLAHPSRWEGFGLVLLEAMATHLPIVAAAVSAIPKVVEAETNGLLVPPDDAAALAGALDRVLSDPLLRDRLAEHGHRKLTERFSPYRMAKEHEDVYETAMREPHGVR